MTRREYQKVLEERGLGLGALQIEPFEMDDLLFDGRTWLKCLFTCESEGIRPADRADLELRQRMLREFSWGAFIRAKDAGEAAAIASELEKRAMEDGYYFAFAIGECAAACGEGPMPICQRPAFYGMGIDLIATARRLQMPISLQHTIPGTPDDGYATIFVE
ncbi:hypothetical protein H8699_09480 [Christensenellaceae bacterium NSJ-44]|uniref:Uncharacterized protein n=1 Tax=Luoshenia tenuis TaxID=2763654 RepID=A0A926D159_9FIRM|nr:hypothetical protein [Luoshenia tenuis]MBC8529657.1 hypothetical protein [Luoshenia tenuis]